MRRTAILIILVVGSAHAHAEGPSFDCANAGTPAEKTICADENAGLALRDEIFTRLYKALKSENGHDEVLAEQAAWLKQRDACGAEASCLQLRYDERLRALAREAGDAGGVTGNYHYRSPEDAGAGDAFIVRELDGTLTGDISTVSGPTHHTCELGFDGAQQIGDAWLWIGPEDETDVEGSRCHVLIRPAGQTLRIDSRDCSYYCGVRGFFDATYERVK